MVKCEKCGAELPKGITKSITLKFDDKKGWTDKEAVIMCDKCFNNFFERYSNEGEETKKLLEKELKDLVDKKRGVLR